MDLTNFLHSTKSPNFHSEERLVNKEESALLVYLYYYLLVYDPNPHCVLVAGRWLPAVSTCMRQSRGKPAQQSPSLSAPPRQPPIMCKLICKPKFLSRMDSLVFLNSYLVLSLCFVLWFQNICIFLPIFFVNSSFIF